MQNLPLLKISDGTTTINLLNLSGWLLKDWKPNVAEPKGGGVFRNSPLTDGRKLVFRRMDNIIDTFNLVGSDTNQDNMIYSIQELQRLLERAVSYWTADWQNQPVYISARAPNETNTRYAVIMDYRLSGFGGPFQQPFFSTGCNSATEAILAIEHGFWQSTIPGENGACIELSNQDRDMNVDTITTDSFAPNASAGDMTISSFGNPNGDLTGNILQIGFGSVMPGNCSVGILFDNVTIANGTRIIEATLTLTQTAGSGTYGAVGIIVLGQDPASGDATVFDGTPDDWYNRTRIRSGYYNYYPAGTFPSTLNVTDIIQQIVNSTGWDSGDDLALFIYAFPTTYDPVNTTEPIGRQFDSFDPLIFTSSGAV